LNQNAGNGELSTREGRKKDQGESLEKKEKTLKEGETLKREKSQARGGARLP